MFAFSRSAASKIIKTVRTMSALSRLGLSEAKIKDTEKNAVLCTTLNQMIREADEKSVEIDKNTGTLIYTLAGKLKKKEHLPAIYGLILQKKITNDMQLVAAMEYVKANPVKFELDALENACGVGVTVTPEQIKEAVLEKIEKNLGQIKTQRYRFNSGPLMGMIRKELKWADGKLVKAEIESQIAAILGSKTDEDNKPVQKIKQKKAEKKPAAVAKEVKAEEPQEMSFSGFHKPGENYTTEGYVITDHTMRLMKEHLERTGGKIRTRFPPEPNGILHIGHAKAININFGFAKSHEGVCFLRYDDTNPEKEEEKFFTSILDMVTWLGYTPYKVTHSSDNFQALYDLAVNLIKSGDAYVCHQTADEMKGFEVKASPWRDRPIEESLLLFEDMKHGKFDEGTATLRMKCVLEEGKQDPVAYRIKYLAHHRTGDAWCIYPTYDYTHCLCDSFEDITHSLCTKEFQNRRSSYYWLCNVLEQYCPVQWEYGRLNIGYTIMSKRKIAKLIAGGLVADYDDPRLFTLTALRRRGFPPQAINTFVKKLGLTGALTQLDPLMLEACVRDELNLTAGRVMAVLSPLKVIVVNSEEKLPYSATVPDIPGQEPSHDVSINNTFYIDRSDFRTAADKDYRRLSTDQTVGLKHVGMVAAVVKVEHGPSGEISELHVKLTKLNDTNKPRAFIQWVSNYVVAEVREYSRLFNHRCPEDPEEVPGGFLTDVNTDSLKTHSAYLESRVLGSTVHTSYQFERIGYYTVDQDSTGGKLVFNNTVSLREDSGKS